MIYAFVRNDAFVITSLVLELVWRIQAACCEAAVCNKYIIAVRVVPWFVTILFPVSSQVSACPSRDGGNYTNFRPILRFAGVRDICRLSKNKLICGATERSLCMNYPTLSPIYYQYPR